MDKRKLIPLAALILIIIIGYFLHVHHELSMAHLRKHHDGLQHFIQQHPFISPLLFILIYTVSVILIIPDSTILTLFGGLFFAWPLAILYSAVSETLGALIFFWIAGLLRKAKKKEAKFIHKMRRYFQQDPASYLLFLRISHILPFWFISFAAAYFNAPVRTFIWTTFLGTIPYSAFVVSAGHDLKTAIAHHAPFKASDLFTLHTELAFLGIAILTLLPLFYKKWKKR